MEDRPVRRIPCEAPEQKMWDMVLFLENEPTVLSFLEKKYELQGVEYPKRSAFLAVQPFIHYIKQARETYRAAQNSDVLVQPLLAYYGMMNLTKVWMLSLDPEYPRTTSVMRHGVSTRKRKKRHFRFHLDEVRIQQEGLFAEVARLNGLSSLIGEVFTIRDLFAMIPELQDGYRHVFRAPSLFPVAVPDRFQNTAEGMPFYMEEAVLDACHLTPRGLVSRLNRHCPDDGGRFRFEEPAIRKGRLRLIWNHPRIRHVDQWAKGFHHPCFREDAQGGYYLYPDSTRNHARIPEFMIHYLLLFALSMLSRYEPPLWGEMVYGFTSEDMVLIHEFLHVTLRKFPNLILNELFEEKLIFRR